MTPSFKCTVTCVVVQLMPAAEPEKTMAKYCFAAPAPKGELGEIWPESSIQLYAEPNSFLIGVQYNLSVQVTEPGAING